MNNGELVQVLSSINPISLEAIGGLKLMNRVETKYVFSAGKLVDLINLLDDRYKVLEINNLRGLPYNTTYMDTPGCLFYNQHVRGEVERHKIRYRKYESSGDTFLEIKKKTNKGRTVKWRIENYPDSDSFNEPAIIFLGKHMSIDSTFVKPVLINGFTRTTLIGLESKERITLDYNISFAEPDNKRKVLMPYLAIVELKKQGHSHCSYLHNLLKKLNIRPTSFSKYCTGSAILHESLKKNMIKPKILLLKKIENEYINSHSS
ncbi:MAG: polyphosphate polymerase domain-containing protein [Bacteroidetes bacterium]|nr:MAG: polyphosphate polymerase domain-containing protein [Bacteroidota bacterium]